MAAVASRTPERAAAAARFIGAGVEALPYKRLPSLATRILIAVPDDSIAGVAALLAAGMDSGDALHTSGVYGVEVLAPLLNRGVSCATLHPLQTVSSPGQGVDSLEGAWFGVSGDGSALGWAQSIVKMLAGSVVSVRPDGKPLYHAAAVIGSNYLVALVEAAVELMERAGVGPSEARSALGPLMRRSLENALALGPAQALTGPIQRGDTRTVMAHLEAIDRLDPESAGLYRALGLYTLKLAQRGGLPATVASRVEERLRAGTHENG